MADDKGKINTLVRNLKDAGCDGTTVEQFMELEAAGEKQKQFKLLETHRKSLLNEVHENEKKIDCLDYLVYHTKRQSNKEKDRATRTGTGCLECQQVQNGIERKER